MIAPFRNGLRRLFCEQGAKKAQSIEEILSRQNVLQADAVLSREEVSTILRKKKQRDRIVREPQAEGKEEPQVTLDQVKRMQDAVEARAATPQNPAIVPQEEKPLFDFHAYSSKLEEYLRGLTPLPTHIREIRYGLPLPNVDPEFRGIEEISDILRPMPKTPNENLWAMVPELTGDSSYEDFELALRNRFNFEADMYGETEDVLAFQDRLVEAFKEELVPIDKLMDPKYMDRVRECFSMNLNMPGSMEVIDPNRLLPDLRPVEEMRNTPLIPIADRAMREFQKRLEIYHLKKHQFAVKRESVFGAVMFGVAAFVFFKILSFILEKDEEIMLEYERMKVQRIRDS